MKNISDGRLSQLGQTVTYPNVISELEGLALGILSFNWVMFADAAFVGLNRGNRPLAEEALGQLAMLLAETQPVVKAEEDDPCFYVANIHIALRDGQINQAFYLLGQLRPALYNYQKRFDSLHPPQKESVMPKIIKYLAATAKL